MITEKIIKQVTELANLELHKEFRYCHFEEWQTKYILEAYRKVEGGKHG